MSNVKSIGRRYFGPGQFYKSALSIAVPIMLQQLIQSMVSLIDNFMVAGLGDVSMSGVSTAGAVLFVFFVYIMFAAHRKNSPIIPNKEIKVITAAIM